MVVVRVLDSVEDLFFLLCEGGMGLMRMEGMV